MLSMGAEYLLNTANILQFNEQEEMSKMKTYEMRRYLVRKILDNPVQVLNHLSEEDYFIMEQLIDTGSGMCLYGEMTGSIPPAVTLGLIGCEEDMKEKKNKFFMTEDLSKALEPHIGKAKKNVDNRFRLHYETIILGLLNLYGCCKESELKAQLKRLLQQTDDGSGVLDRMMSQSAAVQLCCYEVEDEEKWWFASPFAHIDQILEERQLHPELAALKPFDLETVMNAGLSPIPIIPNNEKDRLADFLMENSSLDKLDVDCLQHTIWLLAQLLQNKEEVMEHIERLVDNWDDAKPIIDDYLNKTPQWRLRGYSTDELCSKDGQLKPRRKTKTNKKKKEEAQDAASDKILDIFEELQEKAGQLDNEQKERLRDILSGKTDWNDMMNEQFYRYHRPDYSKKGARLALWLAPFWNVEHDDNKLSLCGFVDEDGGELSQPQKKEDLRNYLYLLFEYFDKEAYKNEWQLYGPLWLMEKYDMDHSLDVVLEVLRQDAHFLATYVEGVEQYMVAVVYQLGHKQLNMLEGMLYEDGLIPTIKPIVFCALALTAIRQPQQRMKAMAIINKYLNHCLTICQQGASPANIEQYAHILATAHLHEAMPLLKKLFEEIDVPCVEYDGIDDFERIMNDESEPFLISHDKLNDYLLDLKDEVDANDYRLMPYGDFGIGDEQDEDKQLPEEEIYDNSTMCSRYTVRMELLDAPEMVERTLQVPSNIYLDAFANLIMIAFGRKDCTEHYTFVTKDDSYNDIDAELYTLAEVVKKKGNTASFNILKAGKPAWRHAILLERSGTYSDKTTNYIQLIDGHGTYPNRSTRTMADHVKLFEAGKVRLPNFKKIRNNLLEYELDHQQPE